MTRMRLPATVIVSCLLGACGGGSGQPPAEEPPPRLRITPSAAAAAQGNADAPDSQGVQRVNDAETAVDQGDRNAASAACVDAPPNPALQGYVGRWETVGQKSVLQVHDNGFVARETSHGQRDVGCMTAEGTFELLSTAESPQRFAVVKGKLALSGGAASCEFHYCHSRDLVQCRQAPAGKTQLRHSLVLPLWKDFTYPASEFHPEPFTLSGGEYRYDIRQVDPAKNYFGQSEEGKRISLGSQRITDVDGDGEREAWVELYQSSFNVYGGNSIPVLPTGVFVFRLPRGAAPALLGVVSSKDGDLTLGDGWIRRGGLHDPKAEAVTEWRIVGGRLTTQQRVTQRSPDALTSAALSELVGKRLVEGLSASPLRPALERLLGKQYDGFIDRLGMSAPARREGDYVVGFGFEMGGGGLHETCYAFGLTKLDLHVALRTGGGKFKPCSSAGSPPPELTRCYRTTEDAGKRLWGE